jgi:WD40 repeat protein
MSRLDDRLTRELERAARPASPAGAFERVDHRRGRRARLRKIQAGALVVVVLGGTAGGFALLVDRFDRGSVPADAVLGGLVVLCDDDEGTHLCLAPESAVWGREGGATAAELIELTSGNEIVDAPSVSPDASTIVFSRRDTRTDTTAIWSIGVDGSSLIRLTDPSSGIAVADWSPDGAHLVGVAPGISQLYVMSASGAIERSLDLADLVFPSDPAWSPDGSRILFVAGTAGPDQVKTDVFSIDVDGTNIQDLTNTPTIDEFTAAWSPDGARIVYAASSDEGWTIRLRDADGSNPLPVRSPTGDLLRGGLPEWSPDGTWIGFSSNEPTDGRIVAVTVDGSAIRTIAATTGPFDWIPDPGSVPPSPQPSPDVSNIGLGFPVCNVETFKDDFNRDGVVDTAWTATKAPDAGPCPTFDESFTVVAVDLTGDGVADGSAGLLEHCGMCHPFAATDLDGDGVDELLVIEQWGSVTEYAVFSIHPEQAAEGQALAPISVAPPEMPRPASPRVNPSRSGQEGMRATPRTCDARTTGPTFSSRRPRIRSKALNRTPVVSSTPSSGWSTVGCR